MVKQLILRLLNKTKLTHYIHVEGAHMRPITEDDLTYLNKLNW